MKYAVETHELTKYFRRAGDLRSTLRILRRPQFVAVDHLNLQVEPGEVFGLLGPNGAGKTTLVKMLCTMIWPTSGAAVVNGYDIRREEAQVRSSVGLVTCDERSFYYRLTGWQNLSFYAALYHLPPEEARRRISEVLELLDMDQYAHQRFQEYSTGMKQKLAIARGLLSQPQVLFMDEPTRSLDPLSAQALRQFIKQRIVREAGRTVMLATHQMSEVEHLCDRVAVISHGRLAAEGTIAGLRARFRRWDRYQLEVNDLDHMCLDELRRMPGVLSCTPTLSVGGAMALAVDMERSNDVLPELLHFIMHQGGRISRCTLEEVPLEEVLASILEKSILSAPQECVSC